MSPEPGDVVLRDVAEGDLPILFDHQQDPEANRMAAFPARDRDAFMAHWAGILADHAVVAKSIVVDGRVAGNVVSWEQSGRRQIGYWIGRDHWGRGLATRALSAFVGEVASRPLHAHVAKHNVASIRVLEKCGFVVSSEETSTVLGEEAEEFIYTLES
jgi:RimJ/RimL family protein N-acetyltransferase